jgi:hypothetical protein
MPTSRRRKRAGGSGNEQQSPETSAAVLIELTPTQVNQVQRQVEGDVRLVFAGLTSGSSLAARADELDNPRLSRSLLTGLLVLATLPRDGGTIGVAEIARLLGLKAGTTHRYVITLKAAELVEQDPATRRYRLAA